MDLRTALRNIHADPAWWRKVLAGGALYMTIVAAPFAAGLIVENIDNARKGYPTPLPPWGDWSSRYLIGLFAGIIDFLFFALPVLLGGMLFFCIGISTVIARDQGLATPLGLVVVGAVALFQATMFAVGVSPVGRLIFVEDGGPERAMSSYSLREALRPGARSIYAQARVRSLPAYVPAIFAGALTALVLLSDFPGALLVALVLVWVTLCAVFYAHLAVAQLYAAADKTLERRGLGRAPREYR